jgi:DNA repair protein RadA/Sms
VRRRPASSAWVTSTDAALPLADVLASAAAGKGWRAPLVGALGAEVSRVLGGGVVPGSLTLVGGDPGVGKSTLLLQLAALLAAPEAEAPEPAKKGAKAAAKPDDSEDDDSDDDEDARRPVLYVSGEESVEQVASRASRLGLSPRGVYLMAATNVESILETMATLRPRAVVVDSIQTVYLDEVAGSAGSVSQVRECASALLRAAKGSGTPVFLVGHVTKGGDIAGPRTLEHIVDVVLYLEGEALREFRLLRGVKNRFGATDEVGVFSMAEGGLIPITNPSAAFLGRAVTPHGVGAAVTVTCEGTRPMALEIQALCAPAYQAADAGAAGSSAGGGSGGMTQFVPSRRSATGIKPQRLNLLLAVLSKRALGPGLYSNDVFVNVVGGMQLDEPATDLAICAAIGAAFFDAQLPGDVAFVGEVGLGGELRAVPQAERRVAEAARLGFTRVLVPVAGGAGAVGAAKYPGCRVVPCATVAAALEEALGAAAMTSRRGKSRKASSE